jgi:hypothetical protein
MRRGPNGKGALSLWRAISQRLKAGGDWLFEGLQQAQPEAGRPAAARGSALDSLKTPKLCSASRLSKSRCGMVAVRKRESIMKSLLVAAAVVFALVTGITATLVFIPQPAVADCGGSSGC